MDLKTLRIFTKKCTPKPNSFLAIDTTLTLDNPLRFRRSLLERIWKLIVTIDDKIRDEKLQHDINREEAKISAFSLDIIDKDKYHTGEEVLSPDQNRIKEEVKFTYSPLGKSLVKTTETVKD